MIGTGALPETSRERMSKGYSIAVEARRGMRFPRIRSAQTVGLMVIPLRPQCGHALPVEGALSGAATALARSNSLRRTVRPIRPSRIRQRRNSNPRLRFGLRRLSPTLLGCTPNANCPVAARR